MVDDVYDAVLPVYTYHVGLELICFSCEIISFLKFWLVFVCYVMQHLVLSGDLIEPHNCVICRYGDSSG